MNLTKLVWREFKYHKSQLITGLLAITLGVAVIVGIRSVSVVSEKAVAISLDNLGANILVLPQGANVDNYYTADIDAPTFPEAYVEIVATSALQGVDNMSPKLTRRITVRGQKLALTGILPKNELASKPLWQKSGLFGAGAKTSCAPRAAADNGAYKDEKLQRKSIDAIEEDECILGSSAAQRLHLKENDTITLEGGNFKVAKVLTETGTIDDDRIFAHLHTVQHLLGIKEQVSAIEIMGCCNAITDGLLSKLRNLLPDTKITTIGQIVATQVQTNKLMNKVSLVFLVIILFVGGVSIGNFMWANVNERRKEIGMLRMIGFSRGVIYRLLLAKALILGIMGGALGYVIGTGAAMWLGPQFAQLAVQPLPQLLPAALAIAAVVALLGSAIPAYLAGKIDPFINMQEE